MRYNNKKTDLKNRLKLAVIILTIGIPLTFVNECHGQNLDSLNQRILSIEMNQRNIQLNLKKSHKQFSTGTLLVLTGSVITTGGALLAKKDNDASSKAKSNNALLIFGAAMTTVGVVIQIDSHKWIGRAGKRHK